MKNEQREKNDGSRYGGRKEIRLQIDNEINAIETRLEKGYQKIRSIESRIESTRKQVRATELRLARIVIMDAVSAATKHTSNRDQLKGIARERLRWHYKIEWCGEIERQFEAVLNSIKK